MGLVQNAAISRITAGKSTENKNSTSKFLLIAPNKIETLKMCQVKP